MVTWLTASTMVTVCRRYPCVLIWLAWLISSMPIVCSTSFARSAGAIGNDYLDAAVGGRTGVVLGSGLLAAVYP